MIRSMEKASLIFVAGGVLEAEVVVMLSMEKDNSFSGAVATCASGVRSGLSDKLAGLASCSMMEKLQKNKRSRMNSACGGGGGRLYI